MVNLFTPKGLRIYSPWLSDTNIADMPEWSGSITSGGGRPATTPHQRLCSPCLPATTPHQRLFCLLACNNALSTPDGRQSQRVFMCVTHTHPLASC